MHLIGILGTHTEVGKTWVTCRLISTLRQQGFTLAARKPVQSFDPNDTFTDAQLLAQASGESELDVCGRRHRYALAMAPPMAADALGNPRIELDELVETIRWPANLDFGFVETVGGPYSPISHDGDSIDLMRRLQPIHIVLVADAGLGTINSLRLCLQCIQPLQTTVFLNRYDDMRSLHRLNRQWLWEHCGIQTLTTIGELAKNVSSIAN